MLADFFFLLKKNKITKYTVGTICFVNHGKRTRNEDADVEGNNRGRRSRTEFRREEPAMCSKIIVPPAGGSF